MGLVGLVHDDSFGGHGPYLDAPGRMYGLFLVRNELVDGASWPLWAGAGGPDVAGGSSRFRAPWAAERTLGRRSGCWQRTLGLGQ